jgi:protein-disulfide isomerase
MCVSIHALSLGLCFALQRAIARPIREQWWVAREVCAGLLRSGALPEGSRWQAVGFALIALVAATSYQWVYVESALRRPAASPPPDPGKVIAAYNATPEQALPVGADDPHRGPLDAPVELVVFESFQCPHCQRFAATLPRLEHEFGDRLLVVFKHYPLSSRCNDRMATDLQPDACEIAWAAEAAQQQARFWPFHDAMLAAGPRPNADAIAHAAHGAGVELARFEADRRSPAVRDRVADDIALGNKLKLPGTPAAYLDGRLVRPTSAEVLEILIRHELERRTTRAPTPGRAARSTGPPAAARRPTMDG